MTHFSSLIWFGRVPGTSYIQSLVYIVFYISIHPLFHQKWRALRLLYNWISWHNELSYLCRKTPLWVHINSQIFFHTFCLWREDVLKKQSPPFQRALCKDEVGSAEMCLNIPYLHATSVWQYYAIWGHLVSDWLPGPGGGWITLFH